MTLLERPSQGGIPEVFDYGALDSEIRIVVQQKTGEIRERLKRTAQDIIEIGERLILVKDKLGHGHFGAWLKAEFGLTDQTARNFMNVAEAFKSQIILDLTFSPTALVALSAPSVPQEARDEAIDLAFNGHPVTVAKAKELVAKHQPTRPQTRPTKMEDDTSSPEDESQEVPDEDDVSGPRDLLGPVDPPATPPESKVVINLSGGPTFPPTAPRPTGGWDNATGKLNDIILFVREQAGISGSIHGWSAENRRRLLVRLERFQEHIDQWVGYLRENP